MSEQLALFGMILVSLLWGSWFQTVKHIGKFPTEKFITLMYGFSVVIVWLSIAGLGPSMIPTSVFAEISSDPKLAIIIGVCGIVFGIAMQLHLMVVKRVGLIISTSVIASAAILGGTIVTIVFAGVPEGVSIFELFLASFLLIMATIVCQIAGVINSHDKGNSQEKVICTKKDILLLAFINLILMSSYPVATSLGLRSSLNPDGFSSLTCMGVLVIGAFVGSLFFSVVMSRINKDHDLVFNKDNNYLKLCFLALIAAGCHFGGNVLQAIFAPVISVTIATVMGNSYHVWSYVWGMVYGEFKGAKAKVFALLLAGILMFVSGVLILSV